MVSATAVRVPMHTDEKINEMIRRRTEKDLECSLATGKHLNERLAELDREWDVDRTVETGSAGIALAGLVFSFLFGRRWLLLTGMAAGMLMRHAVRGGNPMVALLRRLGVRTQREIDQERTALKLLRGDFQNVPDRGKDVDAQAVQLLSALER